LARSRHRPVVVLRDWSIATSVNLRPQNKADFVTNAPG